MEHQVSAGGVVIKKDKDDIKVLLIKDRFGHWTWPKGHIESGETLECAALREINEETGLSALHVESELGEQRYSFSGNGKQISKVAHIFLVEASSGEKLCVQESEIDDAAWFDEEEALIKIEYEGSKEILAKGIKKFKENCC